MNTLRLRNRGLHRTDAIVANELRHKLGDHRRIVPEAGWRAELAIEGREATGDLAQQLLHPRKKAAATSRRVQATGSLRLNAWTVRVVFAVAQDEALKLRRAVEPDTWGMVIILPLLFALVALAALEWLLPELERLLL